LKNAKLSELKKIKEIGDEIASSVYSFFSRKENLNVLKKVFDAGVEVEDVSKAARRQPLKDKTFVFTGELEHYTRQQASRQAEELGARVTSSVSANTDFVVAGENPGSKLEEARKRNVEIIDEQKYEELTKNAK
jgi:DNA ligase (NAD+)